MISIYDIFNIAFYFLFIIGVAIYFSRRSANSSDYFRGGGAVPWWITGASAWMAGFSAWSFTGAAGKIYETGTYVIVLYYQNIIPVLVLYFFTCFRFRRLRVVTPIEALRLRFGPATQQFYTWARFPVALIFMAFMLNSVGVFIAAVFQVPVANVLVVLGLAITVMSILGGAMGVAASDFVQMFLIVNVAGVICLLALTAPQIGGLQGLLSQVPPEHLDWNGIARPEFIGLWFLALSMNTLFVNNSVSDDKSSKYMMAESDSHARKMMIIPFFGYLLSPVLFMIPPMAAAVLFGKSGVDLGTLYPHLSNPNEGAFLAIAQKLLPQGMLGLLICCIFAASITDMGGALNWCSGLLLRNFYLPVINPDCPERKLVKLSRFCSAGIGVLVILLALWVNDYRVNAAALAAQAKAAGLPAPAGTGLFDLLNKAGVALLMPLAIPACLGLFYKRTPSWSAWSTALIGLVVSFAATKWMDVSMLSGLSGMGGPYKGEEVTQFNVFGPGLLVAVVCTAWFFFTRVFYEKSPAAYKEAVEEFFARANRPLPDVHHQTDRADYAFAMAIGKMCLIYGTFIAAFAAIPNSLQGRLCYVGIGGLMAGFGFLLIRGHRKRQSATATAVALDSQSHETKALEE